MSVSAQALNEQRTAAGDRFRLVVWNCNGGLHKKHSFVQQFDPDLAVICEARRKCLATFDHAFSSAWTGQLGGRGLAVIGYKGWKIPEPQFEVSERWFLPVAASNGKDLVRIVGVCAQKAENYVAPTLRAIGELKAFIGAGPAIVAGDFNQSPATDHKYPPSQRSSETFALMTSLDMRSAWHSHRTELHGRESLPTHYWGTARKPFHIDYAFVSRTLVIQQVYISSSESIAGLSDHAALVVDFRFAKISSARAC